MTARHIITDPDSALISSSDLPQSTEYNQASKTHDLVDQDLSFIPSVEKFNLLIQNQNECKYCIPRKSYRNQTKSISDATDLQNEISLLMKNLFHMRYELRLALVERKALTAQLGIDRKKTFNNNNKTIKLESQRC